LFVQNCASNKPSRPRIAYLQIKAALLGSLLISSGPEQWPSQRNDSRKNDSIHGEDNIFKPIFLDDKNR